jgi:hypothetical protein
MQFFHGGDPVAQGKRLNARKQAGLDATVGRRVLNAEALRLGIDKTDAYVDRVNGFQDSLVFDTFVQKVIVPDSRMREEEVKTYYAKHGKEYSNPGMMRIRALAFTTRAGAEAAAAKLRTGVDFAWLAVNADSQVDKSAQGLLVFDGRPVTTDSMPEGLRRALLGATAGNVRLYSSPEGHHYALAVQSVVVPSPKAYEEVRDEISKKLYAEKIKKNVEAYAARLRTLGKVEIYLQKVN